MIITKLQGGLGNQMFQYALGRNLAITNKTEVKFDLSFYKKIDGNKTTREYTLNHFNIIEKIATENEIKKLKKYEQKKGRRNFFHNTFIADNSIYIKEKQFNFDENIFKSSTNIYLDGYWQSKKYFKNIENIIHKEFILREEFQIKNEDLKQNIVSSNSVSLHIRRGDYINNRKTNEVHGLCSLYYYQKSLEIISKKQNDLKIFVFSDDIEWAKNNLKTNFPTIFIENNKDCEDLILMSLCKHNIIANSSFSWWRAWLNQNPDKIVIAPKEWFNDPNKDTTDLIPKSWIRI